MIYDIVTQILKMIIFSSSPRNQLPNHGLRAGAKYGEKPETATSASSSVPQLFAEEPVAKPRSEGRCQVRCEARDHNLGQQLRASDLGIASTSILFLRAVEPVAEPRSKGKYQGQLEARDLNLGQHLRASAFLQGTSC